jgi:hypothetical protein
MAGEMARLRKYRQVPAKRGMRVRYTGGRTPQYGTITGTHGCNLMIRLDGHKHSSNFHPTWELEYLP